jgi:hypothetical protein
MKPIRQRYFWALVNLNNAQDPKDMEWMVLLERQDEPEDKIYYDMCGSDEGVREHEIAVYGPTIKPPVCSN